MPHIEAYIARGTEFSQRFGYILLLGCYMAEEYLPRIFSLLEQAHTQYYYTHMGAAWLIAEVLVKFYECGVSFLQTTALDAKTDQQSHPEARESYRLTTNKKIF